MREYWGYGRFRPLQQEIIEHVLQGKDALALLPTGGGKSLCFQIPAMAMRGICVVISPLIALMRDQVDNLERRGIPARTLYSGQSRQESEWILNAAVNGRLKFLYVSPERCQNPMFLAHFPKMPVCLLAVDEAHCVSQWGYDFRPPYLEIVRLRAFFPKVPLLALTATATADVVDDIQDRLGIFPHKVFRTSFLRENLTYYVLYDEDKMGRLERIAAKVRGCGIVYVRNRKKALDIARTLQQRGITATAYHAGLDLSQRTRRQEDWIKDRVRVMVATNAFGMGIDKPDVRFVVHWDLPDTLEAYFQEAGRAGRDGKRSFALMLHHPADLLEAEENFGKAYPSIDQIRRVYTALCDFYRMPEGCGEGSVFPFDLKEFSSSYRFDPTRTLSSLSFLEKEGLIRLSESVGEHSRVRILCRYEDLYRYMVDHPYFEPLLKFILRTCGGRAFGEYAPIDEKQVSEAIGKSREETENMLSHLSANGIWDYRPLIEGSSLTFVIGRRKLGSYFLSPENYLLRKETARRKLDAVESYARERSLCRNRYLLQYFSENLRSDCGRCDICMARRRPVLEDARKAFLLEKIRPLLQERACSLQELFFLVPEAGQGELEQVWDFLLAEEKIVPRGVLKYVWNTSC